MFQWFTKKDNQTLQDTSSADNLLEGLKSAVKSTKESLVGQIRSLVQDSEITDSLLDEVEEILIRADVGLEIAVAITDQIRSQKHRFAHASDMMVFLQKTFTGILEPYQAANHFPFNPEVMNIYLIVGVNGAGKTSFIGKLANRFREQNHSVVIGAGDTFRAAAEEQLQVWAERAGATFVGKQSKNAKDPAAVMFNALAAAKKNQAKVVLLDTAGRLQNKYNLMEELQKVQQVIKREMPEDAILKVLLVVDATTGQNALKQAEVFKSCVNLSGVLLSKLDSSAKGGIVLTIAKEHNLPVQMIGVGEKITDIQPFNAEAFVQSLFNE